MHSLVCPSGPPVLLSAVHHPRLCRRFPPQCRRHPPLHDTLRELSAPPHSTPDRASRLNFHPPTKLDWTKEEAQGSPDRPGQIRLEEPGWSFHQAIPHNVPR